jgi:UDP-N-acetylglucosamine:LPS N-acetylglucosamine transferase
VKPRLVVGRAGLGTIRDCLASTTPFLPVTSGNDPELSHNAEVLARLGLIPQYFDQSLETISPQECKELSFSIFEYWESASMWTSDVAALILEAVN